MARLCELCGANLNIVGDRHRCVGGRPGGQKPLTRLDKDRITRGEMSPADLLPKVQPRTSAKLGRLAKRVPTEQPKPDQTAVPSREPQPSNSDIMIAIECLRVQFEALRSALLGKPRTDA
jgi:hypothetical protein